LKLLGSNEDLENKIKTVKAIRKGINMNFGLEKCVRICLKKKGRVQSKIARSIFEKAIKEMNLREV